MGQPIWASLLLSALAGLTSGELAVIVPVPVPLFVKAGLFFGLAMAAYFALCEGRRAFEKLVVFVLVCASACPISAISAFLADRFLTDGDLRGIDATNVPVPALFFAGFIGAFLVLVTAMFMFSPQEKDFGSLIKALVWSTCGGFLALTEPLGGKVAVVFLVWPTGVGMALCAMLRMEGRSVVTDFTPGETTTDSQIEEKHWVVRIVVGAIIMCAIWYLGSVGYYRLKWAHTRAAMAAAQEKVIERCPPPRACLRSFR